MLSLSFSYVMALTRIRGTRAIPCVSACYIWCYLNYFANYSQHAHVAGIYNYVINVNFQHAPCKSYDDY